MPDATITSTASTFGTISGTFAADQSTVTGTVTGIVAGTLTGSVGVPGPQGPTGATGATGATGPAGSPGAPGQGVPVGGTAGQFLSKIDSTNYNTDWTTVNLSVYAVKANNLSDLADAPTARTNLGLGSLAVVNDAPSNGSQYARKNAAWDVVIPGDRYLTTSTTSNTVGNGNKTFTIGTGLSYTPTQNITISYNAANHMHGEVLTYNSGTGVLTVDIKNHTGSGTYSSWVVNVGGVTPATSVAWGAITGTLSTQTDLQNALDLKLDVTTAASTYYLQTNPAGFIDASALTPYSTTVQADALYYPLVGNPSGFLTSVPAPTLTNLTSDISWDVSAGTGRLLIAGVNDIGGGWTEARLNFTVGVPNQPATGDFWTNGTDFFYRESGSTKTIASQSYVSATYQTLSGMSSYLTTASAAATYFTIASAANKADLASPTFTGAPTLPTGTIATTQSPGNNTTALATTAFVTAAVPAFATTEQAALNTSATTLISPANYRVAGLNTNLFAGTVSGLSSIVLGTGANIGSGYTILNGRLLAPNALTAGYASRGFTLSTPSNAATAGVNYGTASGHAVRVYSGSWGSTVTGVKMRGIFGRRGGSIPAPAPLAERGYGWEWDFSTRTMRILAHNGTTLTNPSVTWNPIISRNYEIMVTSNGSGTISLYIDSVLMGTTTGGPNDLVGNSAPVWWQLELQNEITASGQTDLLFQNPKVYTTNG